MPVSLRRYLYLDLRKDVRNSRSRKKNRQFRIAGFRATRRYGAFKIALVLAIQSRCQPHCKRESQNYATGCSVVRIRLRDLICRTTAARTAARRK